jgi:hypothetical protein
MASKRQYDVLSSDVEAWFRPEQGRSLEGKLLEFRSVRTKVGRKILYIIHTTEPCMAVDQEDNESEATEWPAGTVVGIFSSGGLGAMKRVKTGAQVCIECLGERDTGKVNPMRVFRIGIDRGEPGDGLSVEMTIKGLMKAKEPEPAPADDDDIPF